MNIDEKLKPAVTVDNSANKISARQNKISAKKKAVKILPYRYSYLLITEIADDIFRYVLLYRKNGGYIAEKYGQLRAAELSVESTERIQLHKAGVAWLKTNLHQGSLKVIVMSSSLDFFVRRFELPKLKKAELYKAAAWEVDKLIPIPVRDSYLVLKKDDNSADNYSVSVGAVPRYQVDPWAYLDDSFGGLIPVSTALAALGPRSESIGSAYCYIYWDDDNLHIGFYNSNGLLYSHPIQKTRSFLFDTGPDRFVEKRVVEELTGSIEVFYSYLPEITIKGLVLITSPAKYESLSKSIKDRMDIGISPIIPLAQFGFENTDALKSIDVSLLPLFGAVRAKKKDFVFIPQSLKDSRKLDKLIKARRYIMAAGLILSVQLAAFWGYEMNNLEAKLGKINTERISTLNSEAYEKITGYRTGTAFLTTLKDRFESNNDYYSTILKIISSASPDGIYLESLTANGSENAIKIHIVGYYDGDLSRADIALMKFMEDLKANTFEKLKLQRLAARISGDRKIESFVLDGDWRSDG